MKIQFTTLSLGIPYTTDYCLRLIDDILIKTSHSIYITTDCKDIITNQYPNEERIKIKEINRDNLVVRLNTDYGTGFATDFNFNMRYMTLEQVKDIDDSVTIFTDCDNSLDWWNEEQMQSWLSTQINLGYDFFAPRNDLKLKNYLEDYKKQDKKNYGIFWHKLFNFDMFDIKKPEWDDSPLPAEYLLIFYNNNGKLSKFYEYWKYLHDYLVTKKITYGTWAEGFEIGVSSHMAGFIPYDISFCHPLWKKSITPNGYKIGHPTEV